MDYFVSVDRKAFHDWQLELLIESFKSRSVAHKIFVGMNRSSEYRYAHLENCLKHQNLFLYEDVGEKKGFRSLNEAYQLLWLMNSQKIKSPVCVMKPHMILKRYVENIFNVAEARAFLYSSDPFFTFDYAQENCPGFENVMKNKSKELYQEKWFNLGNCFILNGLPDWFVQKVINVAENLLVHQIMMNRDVWIETVRLSWVITLIEVSKDVEVFDYKDLTSIMHEGNDTILIDYEHGIPPHFNRSMFTYPPPKYLSFGDPIEILSDLVMTPNAHTMAKVAKNVLQKRKKTK